MILWAITLLPILSYSGLILIVSISIYVIKFTRVLDIFIVLYFALFHDSYTWVLFVQLEETDSLHKKCHTLLSDGKLLENSDIAGKPSCRKWQSFSESTIRIYFSPDVILIP